MTSTFLPIREDDLQAELLSIWKGILNTSALTIHDDFFESGGDSLLATEMIADVESRLGRVDGLGVLPVRVRFAREQTLTRPTGQALGEQVEGYEIHHGVAEVTGGEAFLDGCRVGSVWGTHWHGSLESDGFRRAFLREVAAAAGRRFVPAPDTSFAALREEQLDRLGDLIEQHADTDALCRLIESGAPITPEDHLEPGVFVEIQHGALAGLKGRIIRAASGRRFVVEVDFIHRGASVMLDDFNLLPVDDPDMAHAKGS